MSETPGLPDPFDLERERKHVQEVERILYGKTRLLEEALPRISVALTIASLIAGVAGLLDSSGIHLTTKAVAIAVAIAASTVLLVLAMVVAIRLVQQQRSHLQPVRAALKEAYVKSTYMLYSQNKVEMSNHVR